MPVTIEEFEACMADIKANIKAYKARLRTMGR